MRRRIILISCSLINIYLGAQEPHFAEWSLEEKIGQLMMISFEGTTVPHDIARMIRDNPDIS